MYAQRIREALAGSIDTGKLAEAWAALNPGAFAAKSAVRQVDRGAKVEEDAVALGDQGESPGVRSPLGDPAPRPREAGPDNGQPLHLGVDGISPLVEGFDLGQPRGGVRVKGGHVPSMRAEKAVNPALAAFLAAAARAIRAALSAVLGDLWTEGWVLGQLAADAMLTGDPVDWAGWTPADVAAARQVANGGLQRLLADADIRIKSIAESRVSELADVLEASLASDVRQIEPYHKPPGVYSMQADLPPRNSASDLAAKLERVLDNPARAKMVAHTEMARAASAATLESYRETDVREKSWLGAGDAKECPICDANEAEGAVPMGQAFSGGVMAPPQHPLCRCALMPVVA